MVDVSRTVNAQPVKRFFIDIITRDIGLIASVLDLVDNSVDSARVLRGNGRLEGITVNIALSDTSFSIDDNCAGISIHKASNYVFRMGRPEGAESSIGSIGQFGVGLKRSVFKLGKAFIVHSQTSRESFSVDLNVRAWEARSDWDFDMTVHDAPTDGTTGTMIIVNDLYDDVAANFASTRFLTNLGAELRSRHRQAIADGLTITLNGERLSPIASDVASSDLITPATIPLRIPTQHGDVEVRIVAGVAPGTIQIDEDAEPEEVSFPAQDAGWSVFANGRLLLANDRSALTGWGTSRAFPMFHNQYARFRGFVYITAENSSAIPWNTMKTSVDVDNAVWQQTLQAMVTAGRQIITLLNQLKIERAAGLSGLDAPLTEALRTASTIETTVQTGSGFTMHISELKSDAKFPAPSPAAKEVMKRIVYQVDGASFDKVADFIGQSTAAAVGRHTFDHFRESVLE